MSINLNHPTPKTVLYGLTQIRALRRTVEVADEKPDFLKRLMTAKNKALERPLEEDWGDQVVAWNGREEPAPVSRNAIHFIKFVLRNKSEAEQKQLLIAIYEAMVDAEDAASKSEDPALASSLLFQGAQKIFDPDYFPPPELPESAVKRLPKNVIRHLQNAMKIPHPLTGLSKETGIAAPAALILTGWKCVDLHRTADLKKGLFLLYGGQEGAATAGIKAAGFSYVFSGERHVWELSSDTPGEQHERSLDLVQLGDKWLDFGRSRELPFPGHGWEYHLIQRAEDHNRRISS